MCYDLASTYRSAVAAIKEAIKWFEIHNPNAGFYAVSAFGEPMLSALRGIVSLPDDQRTLPILAEGIDRPMRWLEAWWPIDELVAGDDGAATLYQLLCSAHDAVRH